VNVKTDQSILQTKSEKNTGAKKDVNVYYSENKGEKKIINPIQACSAENTIKSSKQV